MGRENIVGRDREISILDEVFQSPDPEFVAVYGRRRVGKTHLVSEFFDSSICFEIIGIHNATLRDQLDNFSHSLKKALAIQVEPRRPESWAEAFRQLESFLDSSPEQGHVGKRVLFFDELPWLNTPRSRFLSNLEHFWNRFGAKRRDLVLVVCGSAASWMIQNIVRAKGGLHNRLTRRIQLLPFSLNESESFLRHRGVDLTPMQIAELYMVMGGVPHYLKQIEPGLSATQVVDRVCFSSLGLLREEFEYLFASLFDDSAQHRAIVQMLAKKRRGLTRNEILSAIGLKSGGSATLRLDELEASGFISPHIPLGKQANDALYRLSDEYTLFYLDWIRKQGKRSPGDGYWISQQNVPRRRAWSGYAFEGLCIKHTRQLKQALGISGVETTEAPWRHRSQKGESSQGTQIDLLIDRRDQTINLCEMKFTESTFTIDRRYADELRRKLAVFKEITGTKKNVFLTMVTTFGVADNPYAKEIVSKSITLPELFRD